MGDVVHALPAVSDLARNCPGTVIEWVIEEDFAEIPRMHRDVARVIPIGLRRWRNQLHLPSTWKQIRAARRDLREYRYDRILALRSPDQRCLEPACDRPQSPPGGAGVRLRARWRARLWNPSAESRDGGAAAMDRRAALRAVADQRQPCEQA